MNPANWSFRFAFALAAVAVAAMLAFAYYAQFRMYLEPCPLCILQRVCFLALLPVLVLAAIHAPKGTTGRRIYGTLALLPALAGIGIAGRHVWLQHLPKDQVPACGPGLEFMLDTFPLSDAIRRIFTGSGECAEVDWRFAGLSMPEWTLFWFVVFAFGALYYGYRRPQSA